MPNTKYTTRTVRLQTPGARAVLAQAVDGVLSNTRIEIQPGPRGLFRVTIEQLERLPRHKRGITRSVAFVISRDGVEHLSSACK